MLLYYIRISEAIKNHKNLENIQKLNIIKSLENFKKSSKFQKNSKPSEIIVHFQVIIIKSVASKDFTRKM